ncbi:hypothetical protein GIB67_004650 [Kingdonia uniflora]|uniref:J domain-containing protein n=1 Tax=Kingdonia uniflora TaxID=39325 RepID=A0A7J7MD64_9MAGN|nr:hypothetical protein GIB67_004650 [Kingdonia uniflora]
MGDPSPSNSSSEFHSILGVTRGASIRDVCKAYKSLVMKWHPDKNPANKTEAESKFRSITQAYQALKSKKQDDRDMSGSYNYYSDEGGDGSRSGAEPMTYRHRSADNQYSSTLNNSLPKSTSRRSHTPAPMPSSLPKSISRRATTPIMFSYSTIRRKPPTVEKKLECTLEELCQGCVKKIKITRDVVTNSGIIVQEEELLRIKVKPGWKKGTKITFEGMGDETPGTLPADITFLIDEKRHSLFKREGDDLVLAVEIPLVKALTGCSLTIPLLGGETMSVSFNDIIYPGYEKIINGQGMPNPKEQGTRGNLRIKFRIIFPTELSDEQRADITDLLQDESS